MKVIKTLFLSLAFISQITVYASYAPDEVVKEIPIPSITQKIDYRSVVNDKNDIFLVLEKKTQGWSKKDIEILDKIIFCESSYNRFAHASTSKENSWGIAQINLKSHPEVSYEQATNIEFSVDFLIDNYLKGNAPSMWVTCYKKANTP